MMTYIAANTLYQNRFLLKTALHNALHNIHIVNITVTSAYMYVCSKSVPAGPPHKHWLLLLHNLMYMHNIQNFSDNTAD